MQSLPAEMVKDATIPDTWRVEKLDSDGDGGIDVAVFSGPNAFQRAAEYAAWKYWKAPTITALR